MISQKISSSFSDWAAAARVLAVWREKGPSEAISILPDEIKFQSGGLLLQELYLRLCSEPGPRLLIDGCWLCRPYGGITRVWQQIFSTWQLPGLIHAGAPVAMINRNNNLNFASSFSSLRGKEVDPLNTRAVSALSEENNSLVKKWNADVFCSSWISNSGFNRPACPELALVHDCLPERIRSDQPELIALRRRWWQLAATHLAVSSATAEDLAHLLQKPDLQPLGATLRLLKRFIRTSIPLTCSLSGVVFSGRQACPMSLFFCRRPVLSAVTRIPSSWRRLLRIEIFFRCRFCSVALRQSGGPRSWR